MKPVAEDEPAVKLNRLRRRALRALGDEVLLGQTHVRGLEPLLRALKPVPETPRFLVLTGKRHRRYRLRAAARPAWSGGDPEVRCILISFCARLLDPHNQRGPRVSHQGNRTAQNAWPIC